MPKIYKVEELSVVVANNCEDVAVPEKAPLNVVADNVPVEDTKFKPDATCNSVPPEAAPEINVPVKYIVPESAVVVVLVDVVAVPDNVAVIVPAEKLPELSLKTIDDAVFVDTAEE